MEPVLFRVTQQGARTHNHVIKTLGETCGLRLTLYTVIEKCVTQLAQGSIYHLPRWSSTVTHLSL